MTAHVTRALDGQLAAASSRDSPFAWNPAEMAFAAVAYGETKDWNDERVRRAAEHLLGIMGERGQFPLGRARVGPGRVHRILAPTEESTLRTARLFVEARTPLRPRFLG